MKTIELLRITYHDSFLLGWFRSIENCLPPFCVPPPIIQKSGPKNPKILLWSFNGKIFIKPIVYKTCPSEHAKFN